jgi:hypothetical protein
MLRFRTVHTRRVTLQYEPILHGSASLAFLQQCCESELDDLTRQFGFRLRRRVTVVLFARHVDLSAIIGREVGGYALVPVSAIFLAADTELAQTLRHELTHFFSARLNASAPLLFTEGLAVWLQSRETNDLIDSAVLPLLRHAGARLSDLLKRKVFLSGKSHHDSYLLAGSFTGFLIRRYGWDAFRRFFRRCNALNFRGYFRKCFGVSLEKAEWQWRTELHVMAVLRCRLAAE